MKQSDNPEEFFKKYGFRKNSSMPHPIHKDTMHFEGLEADYVNRLESELEYWKEAYQRLLQKQEWMTTQEMYRLKDVLKAASNE